MSDEKAIIDTIQVYVRAGRAGDAHAMKQAFFDNATIFSVEKGELSGGPIAGLFAAVEKGGPAPDLKESVGAVDINKNTATVRLELDNWGGAKFTDQMALMKVGGEWKILHKVYVQH